MQGVHLAQQIAARRAAVFGVLLARRLDSPIGVEEGLEQLGMTRRGNAPIRLLDVP